MHEYPVGTRLLLKQPPREHISDAEIKRRILRYEDALDAHLEWRREREEAEVKIFAMLERLAEMKGLPMPEIEDEPEPEPLIAAPLLADLSQDIYSAAIDATTDDNGCWISQEAAETIIVGGVVKEVAEGYGSVRVAGVPRAAHRVTWTWENQQEIPPGYVVDHLCERKACRNPEHLEACTLTQNTHRHLLCDIFGATTLKLRELHDMRRILDADVNPHAIWATTK